MLMTTLFPLDIEYIIYTFLNVKELVTFATALNHVHSNRLAKVDINKGLHGVIRNSWDVITLKNELYVIPIDYFTKWVNILPPIRELRIQENLCVPPKHLYYVLDKLNNYLQTLQIHLYNDIYHIKVNSSWESCNHTTPSILEEITFIQILWHSRSKKHVYMFIKYYIEWVKKILLCKLPNITRLHLEVDVTNIPELQKLSEKSLLSLEKTLLALECIKFISLNLTATIEDHVSLNYCYIDYNSLSAHLNYFTTFLKPFLSQNRKKPVYIQLLLAIPEGITALLQLLKTTNHNNIHSLQVQLQIFPEKTVKEDARCKYAETKFHQLKRFFGSTCIDYEITELDNGLLFVKNE